MEMKQQKAKTSMYKDIIKLKILFLMWVPLLSYGEKGCDDVYEQLLPMREQLDLISSSKKIKLLSNQLEKNRKFNGGYAYARLGHLGPVKIRDADTGVSGFGREVIVLDQYGKERWVTKRTQIRGISRYNSTARDHFEPLDKALRNRQMPRDRYIVYKGQDAKIIDVNNDSISIMIFDHGYEHLKAKEDGYDDGYGYFNALDFIVPYFRVGTNEIRKFEQFLEKGGFDENWVVSYKNSEGKRVYGEIERVNKDELYLKNIKLGKIKRVDEKDIARFEFTPVLGRRLYGLKEGFVSYKNSKGKKAYGKLERVGDELHLKDIESGKRTTKIDEENIARFDFVQASQNEIDHATQPKKKKK